MNVEKTIHNIFWFCKEIFIRRPKMVLDLRNHKECYSGKSYYPEYPSRPVWKNYLFQVGQVMRYGRRNDYYFMYGLDVKSSKEREEYVNFKQFFDRVMYLNVERNRNNSTCILRNKLYFDIFAKGIGITTPNIRAYYSQGKLFVWRSGFVQVNFKDLVTLGNVELFCKEIEGECGAGIFKLKIEDNNLYKNGSPISIQELHELIMNSEYLFQDMVKQHYKMDELYPGSINTIRLITVRSLKDGGGMHIMPSILRIGANGSYVDNTSQGGIAVGFNLETGRLHKYGFHKPQFGFRVDRHPNSGIVLEDFIIPFIKEAEIMALHFHSMMKDIQSVGWDIAIGPSGPIFIEGNDNWEINGPQVGNYGLRKEFEEYFFN